MFILIYLPNKMLLTYAQTVHEYEVNPPKKTILNRFVNRLNSRLFSYFVKQNVLVDFNVGKYKLKLPFSHALPFIFKLYPQYSSNLARIAGQVHKKYSDLTLIDIGANIGDTVALLRSVANFPILCIEGDDYFFSVLETNSAQFSDVHLAKKYVGDASEFVNAAPVVSSGTAHLTKSETTDGNGIQLEALSDILKDHSAFQQAKLLKVDTDGFDNKILRGSTDFLNAARPVIFFEYDPYLLAKQGDDGLSIFSTLSSIGYTRILVYENSGDFVMSANLANKQHLIELNNYYSGREGKRYCDICVFHGEDEDLFYSIRKNELAFFEKSRFELSDTSAKQFLFL